MEITVAMHLIPRKLWVEPPAPNQPSFDECACQIAVAARRLAKGVNIRDARNVLAMWTHNLANLAQKQPGGAAWSGSGDDGRWWLLLERIADRRSAEAAGKMQRRQAPRFLPCIFAPDEHGEPPKSSKYYAGPYGVQDVTTHLEELKALELAADHPRYKLFQQAVRENAGIVETIARNEI